VDIDLAYLPGNDRSTALRNINAALMRIREELESGSPQFSVRITKRQDGQACAMLVRQADATVKIEVSPVLRGAVFGVTDRRIAPTAEEEFGFAEVPVLSFEDLFAGKLVAALDRQHPRDLYDVRLLLLAEGISSNLFRAFLVYLISHDGSLARLVNPRPKAIDAMFKNQFANMTVDPITVGELELARAELIAQLHGHFGESEKEFLLSFKRGTPRWDLLGVEHAPDLPAVRWKLQNLERMESSARETAIVELEQALSKI
jgi:hypothetical protein